MSDGDVCNHCDLITKGSPSDLIIIVSDLFLRNVDNEPHIEDLQTLH